MQKDLYAKIVEERGRDIREIMHTEENYIEKNFEESYPVETSSNSEETDLVEICVCSQNCAIIKFFSCRRSTNLFLIKICSISHSP